MARNRKRAKERRSRRPSPPARSGAATGRGEHQDHSAPDPIEHASPDVELAEAQLRVGRPELEPEDDGGPEVEPELAPEDDGRPEASGRSERARELDAEADSDPDDAELTAAADRGGAPAGDDHGAEYAEDGGDSSAGELERAGKQAPSAPAPSGYRLINFIQGSWRELQRVQWPDRRAVMQATGVVLGFVIVAGAYLGVADALAGKIVDFILK